MVAAAALALFVVTAFTLVVAKGLALFLIALLPIALYAGLFPGAGRSLLWHWVAALVRVVALVIVMGVFLALLVTGLNGLLGVTGGMWTRFLLVIFFMAVMAVGRRQLLDISQRFADSTLQRLEGDQIGGSHGATWIRPYQAGGTHRPRRHPHRPRDHRRHPRPAPQETPTGARAWQPPPGSRPSEGPRHELAPRRHGPPPISPSGSSPRSSPSTTEQRLGGVTVVIAVGIVTAPLR